MLEFGMVTAIFDSKQRGMIVAETGEKIYFFFSDKGRFSTNAHPEKKNDPTRKMFLDLSHVGIDTNFYIPKVGSVVVFERIVGQHGQLKAAIWAHRYDYEQILRKIIICTNFTKPK